MLQHLPLRSDCLWKDFADFCRRSHFLPDETVVSKITALESVRRSGRPLTPQISWHYCLRREVVLQPHPGQTDSHDHCPDHPSAAMMTIAVQTRSVFPIRLMFGAVHPPRQVNLSETRRRSFRYSSSLLSLRTRQPAFRVSVPHNHPVFPQLNLLCIEIAPPVGSAVLIARRLVRN